MAAICQWAGGAGRRKKFKKNCKFDFSVRYYDGEITAVNFYKKGKKLSRNKLYTAGKKKGIFVLPAKKTRKKGEICFINLSFADAKGEVKPLERGKISVKINGGELLALGNACPFNSDGYLQTQTDTYYGRALAVVKATGEKVTVVAEGNGLCGKAEIVVQ